MAEEGCAASCGVGDVTETEGLRKKRRVSSGYACDCYGDWVSAR